MIEELRFLRVHLTADDARALVVQDLIAFQRIFPDTIVETSEHTLAEYFADIGSYGCVTQVKIEMDDETWEKMKVWHRRLKAAIQAEGRAFLHIS